MTYYRCPEKGNNQAMTTHDKPEIISARHTAFFLWSSLPRRSKLANDSIHVMRSHMTYVATTLGGHLCCVC